MICKTAICALSLASVTLVVLMLDFSSYAIGKVSSEFDGIIKSLSDPSLCENECIVKNLESTSYTKNMNNESNQASFNLTDTLSNFPDGGRQDIVINAWNGYRPIANNTQNYFGDIKLWFIDSSPGGNDDFPDFSCSLDYALHTKCHSPMIFTNLTKGTHTFEVHKVETGYDAFALTFCDNQKPDKCFRDNAFQGGFGYDVSSKFIWNEVTPPYGNLTN